MLKCEIHRNILQQRVDVYVFDRTNHFIYKEDAEYLMDESKPYLVDGIKPFLSISYDIWEAMSKEIAKDYNSKNGVTETNGEHLKDLRWVLEHFINKDK